jgi:hypothetical protein
MMKKKIRNSAPGLRRLLTTLIIALLILFQPQISAAGAPPLDTASPIPAATTTLVQFCADPKAKLDDQAVATLVDYVLEQKSAKEFELPKLQDAPGAYYESETRINFTNFLQYSYSDQIPASLTSPASLRYSLWNGIPGGESQRLPVSWKPILPSGKPVIIRGSQRDGITPDLTTGVYYEYDLKKTYILLNHKGRQVLLSISKQINVSDVGKKGIIIGNDDDWTYYYSGETGSAKTGLGWIKSYIYDYFSVGVHVESGTAPCVVRSGIFQWIRAGWSGINFVQTGHIIKGMKRNATNLKTILESPKLPAASQIVANYQQLSALPQNDLLGKYAALQQARQSLAVQNGKIKTSETKKQASYAGTPKEQIIEELMLEYFKITLGKASLLDKKVVLLQ